MSAGCGSWWCPSGTRGPSGPVFGLFCREHARALATRHDVVVLASLATPSPGLRRLPARPTRSRTACARCACATAARACARRTGLPAARACSPPGAAAARGLAARRGARPRLLGRPAGAGARAPQPRAGGGHRALHRLPARPRHRLGPAAGAARVRARGPGGAGQRRAGRPPSRDRPPGAVRGGAERRGHRRVRAAAPPRARHERPARGCSTVGALAEKKGHALPARGAGPARARRARWTWWGTASCAASWRLARASSASPTACASTASCPRSEVAELMRAADLFVLPSLHETFGCVLIEAMASGLPSVATRVGGVPEVLRRRGRRARRAARPRGAGRGDRARRWSATFDPAALATLAARALRLRGVRARWTRRSTTSCSAEQSAARPPRPPRCAAPARPR